MKKFVVNIFNFFLIGIVPVIWLLIFYIVTDPFKVLYSYSNYYPLKSFDNVGYVGLNKDYVSTMTFINGLRHGEKYNSFIFGNSRSMFYQIADWKQHIDSSSICYHFDASGESIVGIERKIDFISNKGIKLENVLLILDYHTLIQNHLKTGHLFSPAPPLLDNENYLRFNYESFSAFCSPEFLYAFIDYKISGKVKAYMKETYILDDRPYSYDSLTNELQYNYFENLIQKGQYYTPVRCEVFFNRDSASKANYKPAIGVSQRILLNDIKRIFDRNKTNYKIIINPLYEQKRISILDIEYLKDIFGKENVFDFSGVNKFTTSFENYYEESHYRPHVAREIMNIIYTKNDSLFNF